MTMAQTLLNVYVSSFQMFRVFFYRMFHLLK